VEVYLKKKDGTARIGQRARGDTESEKKGGNSSPLADILRKETKSTVNSRGGASERGSSQRKPAMTSTSRKGGKKP